MHVPIPRLRLAILVLLLAPLLITAWFVQDGGLANGLNRLAYEASMAAFFLLYALLLALVQAVLRYRHQPCPATEAVGRWAARSGMLGLLWILGAMVYEQL